MKKIILPAYQVNRNAPHNYVVGDLDECISEFSYKTYDVIIETYRSCIVTYEGVVYKNLIQLVDDSLVGPKLRDQYSTKRILKEIIKLKKIILSPNEKYLLAFDNWSIGQYHFITEVLTRLILFKNELPAYTLLLSDNNYVKTIGLELFHFFGLKPKKIHWIKRGELCLASTIDFISHVSLGGYMNDKVISQLQSEIKPPIPCSDVIRKRIYVSRENASYRKVLNEQEVVNFFKNRGYEIVRFEELTLMEQITICMQSEIMVSMHGAGLTNMLFMPKGSAVMEFRRSKIFVNQCYWHLADALNHTYFYFYGNPDSEIPIEGDGCNLYIPLDKLKTAIENIESSRK